MFFERMVEAMMRHRRKQPSEPSPQQLLERSLQETRQRLAQARAGFNAAQDGELVESYIYEINALQSRYAYLLRQRKALEEPSPQAEQAPAPAI